MGRSGQDWPPTSDDDRTAGRTCTTANVSAHHVRSGSREIVFLRLGVRLHHKMAVMVYVALDRVPRNVVGKANATLHLTVDHFSFAALLVLSGEHQLIVVEVDVQLFGSRDMKTIYAKRDT